MVDAKPTGYASSDVGAQLGGDCSYLTWLMLSILVTQVAR
jgi:hypothetical protein